MAVKTSWAAGDVLLAADLTDTFAAKVAYSLPKNAQTGTTYTFVLADAGKLVTASNASSSTYTIPPQSSVTWAADTVLRVVNYGAGTVTFAGGSGVTVTNTAATLAQYQSAALIRTASDAWTVVPFSGGVSKATVTATTGSPTVDTTSRPGKTIYIFSGSGSLTVTAGTCEVLVLGGGGAGGYKGGGGAGGYLDGYTVPLYIEAGTQDVRVGAGGSGYTNGTTSKFGPYYASGGGYGGDNGAGANGGSGGGGGRDGSSPGGSGVTGLGNNGGTGGTGSSAGGGGGASAAGGNASGSTGGNGGAGTTCTITGTSTTRGGGGGAYGSSVAGTGGTGGGGNGSTSTSPTAGQANTGGGGGGGNNTSAAGGSGVVIVVIG